MSRIYPIQIRKHTPKRYRMSHWRLSEPWWGCPEPLNTLYLVVDLTKKPINQWEAMAAVGKTEFYTLGNEPNTFNPTPISWEELTKPKKPFWSMKRGVQIEPTLSKPSFLRNIKHHTIDKLRKGKYNGKE